MTVYHVETQADYDSLMIELEEKGCEWRDGEKLTDINEFSTHGKDTYVYEERCEISISSGDYFKKYHSDMPVIEYKAKGENMTQEKIKQELKEILHDVSVAVCWGLIDTSTVEADLLEAKSSAKKLIENIDEYLETLKPKFKVGDYVIEQNGNVISKIGEVLNGDFWGSYYKKIDNYFGNSGGNILVKNIERHATPEEIKEYESALNFYKHGRNPFEVKEGDMIKTSSGRNIIACYPENYSRVSFLKDGWEFLKTSEEVNEWIRGENE